MNLQEILRVIDKEIDSKLKGEKVIFSDLITKINKKLVEQTRTLIITEKALYNFKEKSLKRRLEIKDIFGITASKASQEFVIHGDNEEYDYHYRYKNKRKIIQILAAAYYLNTFHKLRFSLVKEDNLSKYVTCISEKRKDKSKTKIDYQLIVDIDTYLYGNLLRKNSIGKSRKSSNFASVTKAQKTEIIYLNENSMDLIDHLDELKIENFRILGNLLKSYYGRIFWSEFIPNNNFYLMRVINSADISNSLFDINKVIAMYSLNFVSISPAECIFITNDDKTFIMNKFSPFYEGGPLFYHLKNSVTFSEQKTKIISAQIINIILFFHKKNRKHLNFSPENFILDKNGYVNYLWFEINEKVFHDKCKPEILKPKEYLQVNNDWYNLGILIYEMLFYVSPMNYMDSDGKIRYPKFIAISDEAKAAIEKLLSMKKQYDELYVEDFKKLKFYSGINFDSVLKRAVDPGIVPMNLETQKLNNMGTVEDSFKDAKEEMERDRYTLFNYDSDNSDEIEGEKEENCV